MRLVVAAIVLMVCCYSRATDYFVDYASGSDSANGLTQGTAWKRAPGDSLAGSVPGATTLVAGDRVLFRKSVRYNGQITIAVSGTSGSPITFDGNEWGTGLLSTNTTEYAANTAAFTVSGTRSNLAFRDLRFQGIGGKAPGDPVFSGAPTSYSSLIGGFGIRAESNPRFLTISNVAGSEIGYYNNHIINLNGTVIQGFGIRILGGVGHRINDCLFTNVNCGLSLQEGTGLLLTNVIVDGFTNFGPTRWAIDFAAARNNSTFGHILFRNILHRDMHDYDNANWLGGQDNPHTDGIFIRNPTTGNTWLLTNGIPTVVVENYRWWSDIVGGGGDGTAPIYISQGPSVMIRNSMFGPTAMTYNIGVGHEQNTATQVVYIVNCALYNDARINIQNASASNPNRKVHILNNIFHRNDSIDTPAITISGPGGMNQVGAQDYNLFYHTSSSWKPFQLQSTKYTLGAWQSLFPTLNQHSRFGNPQWSNLVSLGSLCNLHILEGSAAIANGTNITHLVSTDFDGALRSTPMDIGPYLYQASEPGDTNAPTPDPMTWVMEPSVTGPHTAEMSWSTATDDSGEQVVYIVTETTGNPGCSGLSETTSTNHINNDIPYNTTCSYNVRARDSVGNLTAASSTISITTPTQPPMYAARVTRALVNILALSPPVGPTNLFFFDAEGAGVPSGWTTNGSAADWDYSSVVFEGVNTFNAGDTTSFSYTTTPTFDTASSLSMVGHVWRNSVSGTPRKILDLMLDGAVQASAYYSTNGLMIEHGGITNTVTKWSPQQNWYAYRLIYVPGSGANGILRAWWHTNMQFSVGVSNSITTGAATGNINQVMFGHTNGLPGNRFVYDKTWARAGTNSIPGDNPHP